MRHDLNSSGASLPDLDLSKWLKEARNSFSCSWVMPLLSRVRIWFSTSLIVRFTGGGNDMWFRRNHSFVFPRSARGAKEGVRKRPKCKSVTVIYFRTQWTWGGVILKPSVSCCLAIRRCNSLSVSEISETWQQHQAERNHISKLKTNFCRKKRKKAYLIYIFFKMARKIFRNDQFSSF